MKRRDFLQLGTLGVAGLQLNDILAAENWKQSKEGKAKNIINIFAVSQ